MLNKIWVSGQILRSRYDKISRKYVQRKQSCYIVMTRQANRYDVDFNSCLANSPTINLRKMGLEKVGSIQRAHVTSTTEWLYCVFIYALIYVLIFHNFVSIQLCGFSDNSLFINIYIYIYIYIWRNSRQWGRASSFPRFLDHTRRRTTVGRTPLDEWSARHRDQYEYTIAYIYIIEYIVVFWLNDHFGYTTRQRDGSYQIIKGCLILWGCTEWII